MPRHRLDGRIAFVHEARTQAEARGVVDRQFERTIGPGDYARCAPASFVLDADHGVADAATVFVEHATEDLAARLQRDLERCTDPGRRDRLAQVACAMNVDCHAAGERAGKFEDAALVGHRAATALREWTRKNAIAIEQIASDDAGAGDALAVLIANAAEQAHALGQYEVADVGVEARTHGGIGLDSSDLERDRRLDRGITLRRDHQRRAVDHRRRVRRAARHVEDEAAVRAGAHRGLGDEFGGGERIGAAPRDAGPWHGRALPSENAAAELDGGVRRRARLDGRLGRDRLLRRGERDEEARNQAVDTAAVAHRVLLANGAIVASARPTARRGCCASRAARQDPRDARVRTGPRRSQ